MWGTTKKGKKAKKQEMEADLKIREKIPERLTKASASAYHNDIGT